MSEEDSAKVTDGLEVMSRSAWAADLLVVRYHLGLMAQSAGDDVGAIGHLRAALALATASGQGTWVEDCQKALRGLEADGA